MDSYEHHIIGIIHTLIYNVIIIIITCLFPLIYVYLHVQKLSLGAELTKPDALNRFTNAHNGDDLPIIKTYQQSNLVTFSFCPSF